MKGPSAITVPIASRRLINFGVLAITLVLASCGHYTREGTIYADSGETTIPVTWRWLPDGGTIEGTDPQTGESFKGQYYDLNAPPPAVFRVAVDPDKTGATFAYGSMHGDQGSVLDCRMLIGRGLAAPDIEDTSKGPHGQGQCLDSMGKTYLMTF